jgi:hypothetical protein
MNRMHRYTEPKPTTLNVDQSYEGETLEEKINRIVNNNEPIKDGAPLIYQERADGVQPEYNIRTDRFEIAVDAMDKVQASHKAKREEKAALKNTENKATETPTPESIMPKAGGTEGKA